jgi:ribosomal protein S18 acetylase RimI-like enzyme
VLNTLFLKGGSMDIKYYDKHDFTKEELEDLFLSVEWSSGKYPEKLVISMKNFKSVFSAYDNDKLVGLICVMDDGIMNAYIHYLLVNPKYQGLKIGKTLVEKVKEKYKDYLRIAVIGYHKAIKFYEACGFTKSEESFPLFITSLWT